MKRINIAFSTDNNYRPLYVAICSILCNKRRDTEIDFTILVTNDFRLEYKNKIFMLVKDFNNVNVKFVAVEDKFVGVTSSFAHITVPTYYRFLLPNIISGDRLIYLDTDVIVCQDLYELYSMDIDGYKLAGIEAYFRKLSKNASFEKFISKLDITNMDHYINCGVLLMNLSLLRKDRFYENGLEIFRKCQDDQIRICGDQDIINAVCINQIKILKPKYNMMPKYFKYPYDVFSGFCNKADWHEAWNNPVIIHYASEDKPWRLLSVPYSDNWWAYCYRAEMQEFFMHEIFRENVPERIFFKYIFQSKMSAIDRICHASKQIIIYGAGSNARDLLNEICSLGIEVKFFLVKNMYNNPREINGISVYSIADAPNKRLPVVISLSNNLLEDIIKDLWVNGLYNIIYDKFELLWSKNIIVQGSYDI